MVIIGLIIQTILLPKQQQYNPMTWLLRRLQNLLTQAQKRVIGWIADKKASVIYLFYDSSNIQYHHLNIADFSLRGLDCLTRYVFLPENHHDLARTAHRGMEAMAETKAEEAICKLSKLSLRLSEKPHYLGDTDYLEWEILKIADELENLIMSSDFNLDFIRRFEIRTLLDKIEEEYDHVGGKKNTKHRNFTSAG